MPEFGCKANPGRGDATLTARSLPQPRAQGDLDLTDSPERDNKNRQPLPSGQGSVPQKHVAPSTQAEQVQTPGVSSLPSVEAWPETSPTQ